MKHRDILPGRMILGRMKRGDDLLETLNDFVRAQMIRLGEITALGALSKARLSAYDQNTFEYGEFELEGPLEVLNLSGNVSIKDGRPFCHLHATLARPDGTAFGGHVMKGCEVFALECIIKEYLGDDFIRRRDDETGLPLWDI